MKCVKMGWMSILVGPGASGKSSLVHLLALLTGHRLRVMAMNSAMDTTELLGGFEQVSRIASINEFMGLTGSGLKTRRVTIGPPGLDFGCWTCLL